MDTNINVNITEINPRQGVIAKANITIRDIQMRLTGVILTYISEENEEGNYFVQFPTDNQGAFSYTLFNENDVLEDIKEAFSKAYEDMIIKYAHRQEPFQVNAQ